MIRELGRRLERGARLLGIEAHDRAPVTVSVVGQDQMSELHLRWMGLAGPTDVLSIPAAQEGEIRAVGDIVLCWPIVQSQAASGPAQSELHEATVLGVHGLVHLCGHDHRTRRQSRRMHRQECRVLRALRIPDLPRPYVSDPPMG